MASPQKDDGTLSVKIEFTGGLESLFSNKRYHTINLPASTSTSTVTTAATAGSSPSSSTPSNTAAAAAAPPTIAYLIAHLATTYLAKNPKRELFIDGDDNSTVRPGILVLINDADWELEGEAGCVLKEGDEVTFVSTLHGG